MLLLSHFPSLQLGSVLFIYQVGSTFSTESLLISSLPAAQVCFTPGEIPAFSLVGFFVASGLSIQLFFRDPNGCGWDPYTPNPLPTQQLARIDRSYQLPTVNAIYVTIPII